jgi:lipopolysaccharide export system permease protein
MSLLDRYIGRIVAGAFAAGLAFFLFLTIVMDLLGNLSKYVERASRNGLGGFDLAAYLAGYYVKLIPVLFTTITPFVTVIACMFSVARLQGANEVVPMLFVGRSTQRVLRPMLMCGLLAGIGMAGCWQWVVPHFGASIAEAESFLGEGNTKQKNLVIESGESPRLRLRVREYDPAAQKMVGVNMLVEGDLQVDNSLFVAASATWDSVQKDWRLETGWERRRPGNVPVKWLGRSDLTPDILLKRGRETIDPETQSYTELLETMEQRPNSADLKLALHRHITAPLANLILLLLALPMAVYFERGSRIERLLMAIALCGAYMLVDLTCQSLGKQGFINPIVAAWTPTIVFGSLGVVLFGSAKT